MPVNFLTALLTSLIGTLGFAVLLHTPPAGVDSRQLHRRGGVYPVLGV